eukprot:4680945-Pleurochrysis_carterae.AAC.2
MATHVSWGGHEPGCKQKGGCKPECMNKMAVGCRAERTCSRVDDKPAALAATQCMHSHECIWLREDGTEGTDTPRRATLRGCFLKATCKWASTGGSTQEHALETKST